MANSNNLEDLLYEIHQTGVFNEVMEEIKEIKKSYNFMPLFELYEMAFEKVKKKINQGIDFSKN
jgi:hypothetical protein